MKKNGSLRAMLDDLAALNQRIETERLTLKHEAIHEIRLDMHAYGITVVDIAKAMGIKRRRVMSKVKS